MFWFDEIDFGQISEEEIMIGCRPKKKTPHPIFISLSGKKQVGKDTAAKMIVRLCESKGKKVAVTAFAEPLKRMCIEILGLNESQVYGTDEQKNTPSHINWDGFPEEIRLKYATQFIQANDGIQDPIPRTGPMTNREVLQVMGTDIFRSIYGNVWAKAPFNRKWNDVDVVVLTDCRFPNEKIVTEEVGGVIIRLERETGFTDQHPSEIALDTYTFENIYNNMGSFEDLEKYIEGVCKKYGITK